VCFSVDPLCCQVPCIKPVTSIPLMKGPNSTTIKRTSKTYETAIVEVEETWTNFHKVLFSITLKTILELEYT